MKFVCFGYYNENAWDGMTETERNSFVDNCLAYDDVLRDGGHMVGGEGLDAPAAAATLRREGGKVVVTDGPYAETREQIGGILMLEARDRDHAIELISKHPGLKAGPFEIRAVADMSEVVRESERRRGKR